MSSFEIITGLEQAHWDSTVKSFPEWDVYYLHAYMHVMAEHGDGEPLLLYFEGDTSRMCYSVHKRDIALAAPFRGLLPPQTWYDLTTPYGYGGPLADGDFSPREQQKFMNLFLQYCRENGIVTQFVKFHPLTQNQRLFSGLGQVQQVKHTIMMDLSDPDRILANMDPKNRNVIRKARRCGCEIFFDNGQELDTFIRIYELTMDRLEAKPYYYFPRAYYDYLLSHMGENMVVFYCRKDGVIISAAIFFLNDRYMHYHLSGTLPEYRQYAPTNLLLYEAALWGCGRGITQLHLGGGVGVSDSLFGFKKQFNRSGYLPFCIGKTVVDPKAYEYLLDVRCKADPDFCRDNPMCIQYRA